MSRSVIILGGGRSVKEAIDNGLWNKIYDIPNTEIWSCNFAFLLMPYLPHRQLWVDDTFFRNNVDNLEKLAKAGVTLCAKAHPKMDHVKAIRQYKTIRMAKEFEKFPEAIFIGEMGLSGTFALSLAIKEYYKNIYLLGFDFGGTNSKDTNTHWYQEKVKELDIKSSGVANPFVYLEEGNKIKRMVKDYDQFSKVTNKIYNVSLISNISTFQKISYSEFYDLIGVESGK